MIGITSSGSTSKVDKFLAAILRGDHFSGLEAYGQQGVDALAAATPTETGLTARSWTYDISRKGGRYYLSWHNTNIQNGAPIAILIQYGHGTGTGGYVQGRDYINPAIQPLFDKIADDVWEKVKNG